MTIQSALFEQFGDIDVYVFDQLLRGRIRSDMRVLDAGCGGGRNLVYLMRAGADVHANDRDEQSVASVRSRAAQLAPHLSADRFRVEPVERTSFDTGSMDVVIGNSVLHFAADRAHFDAMVDQMWRVLAPGGLLFCRLASTIGMESRFQPLGGGRYVLPDGARWFLVDEAALLQKTDELGGRLLDPLKTTIVQDRRCMTTWVVGKPPAGR